MRNFNIFAFSVLVACIVSIPAIADEKPILDILGQGAGAYLGAKACGGEDTSTACAVMGAQLGSLVVDKFETPADLPRSGINYRLPDQRVTHQRGGAGPKHRFDGTNYARTGRGSSHSRILPAQRRRAEFETCERATVHQNGETFKVRMCQTRRGEIHIFN